MKKKILTLALIAMMAYHISNNFLQILLVNGQSMYPTYHNFQLVILTKFNSDYNPNDVIAFKSSGVDATLIKRIVGVPGDYIIIKDGILYVNNSSYFENGVILEYAGIAEKLIHLKADEYFVLGDNYQQSIDSRYEEIGCICKNDILGKIYP